MGRLCFVCKLVGSLLTSSLQPQHFFVLFNVLLFYRRGDVLVARKFLTCCLAHIIAVRLKVFKSQISFVMEAFFLHYKKPNGTSGNESDEDDDFSLSEQLRVERQLAFAIV